MKRLLQIIVLGGTALVLLAALGLGILLATFNPNDYKDQLSLAVQKATGRQLVFLDNIEVSLFPALGLRTGRVALQDIGGFGAEPFLAVDSASLILAVEPLWNRVIEIDEIVLNSPVLKLATNPAGVHNWQYGFALGDQTVAAKDVREGVTPLEPKDAPAVSATAEKAKARVTLRVRQITCNGAGFSYYDMRNGRSWSGAFDNFSLSDVRMSAATPLELAGRVKDDVTGRQAAFSLKAVATASKEGGAEIGISQAEIVAEGFGIVPVTLTAKGVGVYNSGNRSFALTGLDGVVTVPARPGEEEQPLRADFAGELLLSGAWEGQRASLKGKLLLGELDLDLLSTRLNSPVPVEDTEGVRGAPNMTRVKVAKPQGAQGRGMLSGGAGPGQASGVSAEDGGVLASPAAPISGIPDAELDVQAEALIVKSLPLRKVTLEIRSRNNELRMPCRLEVFGGTASGTVQMDFRPDTPRFSVKSTLKGLNLEEATRALAGTYAVTGGLDGSLDVSGQGRYLTEMVHSLAGKASFEALNGEIRGFSLIPSGLPKLKPVPTNFPFTRISASANIAQGAATSKNILLQSPILTGQGGGTLHLAYGQMDLGVDFKLGGMPPAVPVAISGPYGALAYRVDMPTFMRNVAESAINAPEDTAKGLLRDVGGLLFR